jgi:hypothetical protein
LRQHRARRKDYTYISTVPLSERSLPDGSDVATLTIYDPNSFTVGGHAQTAKWQSDEPFFQSPSATGANVWVQNLFVGFQLPINAAGSTILTGKAGPVKIVIKDADGIPVSATGLVYCEMGTPAIVGTDPENATGQAEVRLWERYALLRRTVRTR